MVAVSIENFYDVMPRFQDGVPATTKKDKSSHGFGVKSMQATCARYGGTLHVGAKDGVFYLNALLAGPVDTKNECADPALIEAAHSVFDELACIVESPAGPFREEKGTVPRGFCGGMA